MKITIGDMGFEAERPTICPSGPKTSYDVHREGEGILSARMDAFLKVAQACYIERHGQPPQRSTKDEL